MNFEEQLYEQPHPDNQVEQESKGGERREEMISQRVHLETELHIGLYFAKFKNHISKFQKTEKNQLSNVLSRQ